MKSVHGHEVMRMMVESGQVYTREGLVAAIHERFGCDARFHTCSADELTAEALVDFLAMMGKFTSCPEGVAMDGSSICSDH